MELKTEMLKIKELAEKCSIDYDNCFEEDVKLLDSTLDEILGIAVKALANVEQSESTCNLHIDTQQRELLKAFYTYCAIFYLNAEHYADTRIDNFIKSL